MNILDLTYQGIGFTAYHTPDLSAQVVVINNPIVAFPVHNGTLTWFVCPSPLGELVYG
jgi:hypothetical protein